MIDNENAMLAGSVLAKPVKKVWNNGPELVLISSNHIQTSKSHPQVHEGTGVSFPQNSLLYITNNRSYAFQGTINEAVS